MKLTFVHAGNLYPFRTGGPGVVAHNLLEQFDKHGVSVEFFLIWNGPSLTASDFGFSSNISVKTIRERRNLISPLAQYFGASGDVVHFNTFSPWAPHVLFPSICAIRGKHIVVSIHGYWPIERAFVPSSGLRKRITSLEYSFLFRHDISLVVFAQYMKKLLSVEFDPARIKVIPLGVDLRKFRPSAGSHDVANITYVGRLSPRKGIEILLRALAILVKQLDFRAYIIGEGPIREGLEGLIEKLALDANVEMLGRLADRELVNHMAETDIIVVPSIYEPIPLVILEAFAANVAVVASNVGGIPELVRHESTGLLVPPNDPEALSSAIRRLILDKDLRLKITRNARKIAERHDWSAVAEKYLALYNELSLRN